MRQKPTTDLSPRDITTLRTTPLHVNWNQPKTTEVHVVVAMTGTVLGNLCNNDGVVIRDYFAVTCSLVYCSKFTNTESVSYRKLRNIDVEQFRLDIRSFASLCNTEGTANDLALRYITGLRKSHR